MGALTVGIKSYTSSQILPAQLAAFILTCNEDEGGLFQSSARFAPIAPGQAVAYLDRQTDTSLAFGSHGRCTSRFLDYIYRPRELEQMNWWTFVARTERGALESDADNDGDKEPAEIKGREPPATAIADDNDKTARPSTTCSLCASLRLRF